MKNLSLSSIIVFLILFLFAIIPKDGYGQNYKSAIGLRVGYPIALTYKMKITSEGALDIQGSFRSSLLTGSRWSTVGAAVLYQHHFDISDILPGLYWFVGGGPTLNVYNYGQDVLFENFPAITIGLKGSFGLDYSLEDAPINLGLDWSPAVFFGGISRGIGFGFGAVSVRYILSTEGS